MNRWVAPLLRVSLPPIVGVGLEAQATFDLICNVGEPLLGFVLAA